jgi:hypothetical protein
MLMEITWAWLHPVFIKNSGPIRVANTTHYLDRNMTNYANDTTFIHGKDQALFVQG